MRSFDNLAAVSRAAAEAFVAAAEAAVAARGRFDVALAGGETPRARYHELAERYGERAFWTETRVFVGDERCVPPADAASNYGMARTELLSRVAVPEAHVYRVAGARKVAA